MRWHGQGARGHTDASRWTQGADIWRRALGAAVLATLLAASGTARATDFYVDPVNGSDQGDGSAANPWQSLQDVVENRVETQNWAALPYQPGATLVPVNPGAPVQPGDRILLADGDYGDLFIQSAYNADWITIEAAPGATPRFTSVHLQAVSHWVIRGLHVSPSFADPYVRQTLLWVESHGFRGPSSDVRIEQCTGYSVPDASAWSAADWDSLACNGIRLDGDRLTARGNHLRNVNFGIQASGPYALVEHNEVVNFSGDGMRGLGDYSVFQYNLVKNCYDVNDNHDDGFQSWSTGPGGVGTGEVVGIELRGNIILNYEDPNQPLRGPLQGIGCFDGFFVDWVVENNLIVVDHWHGITLLGCRNCRIVNNTVLDLNDVDPGPPWIRIAEHKDGTPSENCLVRNNLATAFTGSSAPAVLSDHNLTITDPLALFVDPANHDYHLLPGTAAVDTGSADQAPPVDLEGVPRPQGAAVDLGCYEYHDGPIQLDGGVPGDAGGPSDAAPPPDGGPGDDAGEPPADAASAADAGPGGDEPDEGCGCQTRSTAPSGGALPLLLLLGLLGRARRARRRRHPGRPRRRSP